MTDRFVMNGYLWRVRFVHPLSQYLVDRTGVRTVATTDPKTLTVYISKTVSGSLLTKVLIHEIGHCALYSYDILSRIQSIVKPEYEIEAEEWICNFLADYGMMIFQAAYEVLGDEIWNYISQEIGKLMLW